MLRPTGATTLLMVTLWSAAASAQEIAPVVELYTMGVGRDVFSRYGHAALCVRDAETPDGRCYNYGTTDFSTPIPLTFDVLRGRARFWVSVTPLDRMLDWYGASGERRTVWRQRIPLSGESLDLLEQRLRDDLRPGSREYVYHHFRDNCTTRIRDHLNAVSLGALRRGTERPHDRSWRTMVLEGLGSSPSLLVAGELLLGRPMDAIPSVWEAMFLPEVMRREVALSLHAPPVAVYTRPDANPQSTPGAGRLVMLAAALALGATGLTRRARGVAGALGGIALGAAGSLVWSLSLVSSLPELSLNDLRWVLLPSDLGFPLLPERWKVPYARLRLLMALGMSAASAAGITPQPLLASCLLVAAVMAPWAWRRPA